MLIFSSNVFKQFRTLTLTCTCTCTYLQPFSKIGGWKTSSYSSLETSLVSLFRSFECFTVTYFSKMPPNQVYLLTHVSSNKIINCLHRLVKLNEVNLFSNQIFPGKWKLNVLSMLNVIFVNLFSIRWNLLLNLANKQFNITTFYFFVRIFFQFLCLLSSIPIFLQCIVLSPKNDYNPFNCNLPTYLLQEHILL